MTSNSDPARHPRWHRHVHHFDIDNYLNHFIPRPRIYIFPKPIAHFLGYRSPEAPPKPPPSNPIIWLSAGIGGFVGIALVAAVYHALPLFGGQPAPVVIASFGAAAILEYNTIESPLSQPRNLVVGHLLSAIIGVAITKGFERLPEERFDQLQWLAGSLSVGAASVVMSITKTVHPPAGATALLASTSREVRVLGWWLLPLVLLASCLMTASALVVNNVTRRWPIYWWTPADLSKMESDVKQVRDLEDSSDHRRTSVHSDSTKASLAGYSKHLEDNGSATKPETMRNHKRSSNNTIMGRHKDDLRSVEVSGETMELRIIIEPDAISLPGWMEADQWEMEVLEVLRQKLQRRQHT